MKKLIGLISALLLSMPIANAYDLSTKTPGSVIYFGYYEVEAGKLKSADGVLPKAGEQITLAVDVFNLSTTVVCGPADQYCASLEPRLFVRYSGSAPFQEVIGLPKGYISGRGPGTQFEYTGWESNQAYGLPLDVPVDADRIEVYLEFSRYSYSATDCHLAYDMMECSIINKQFQGTAYVSNYGKNFKISVR